MVAAAGVLRLNGTDRLAIAAVLARYGLELPLVPPGQPIVASYSGEAGARLEGARLHARLDTPVHSVPHQTAHDACLAPERRTGLCRDGGGEVEQTAVCYLQLLLCDALPHVGHDRLMRDVDAAGYRFRRGPTRARFAHDADDARIWLRRAGLVGKSGALTSRLR